MTINAMPVKVVIDLDTNTPGFHKRLMKGAHRHIEGAWSSKVKKRRGGRLRWYLWTDFTDPTEAFDAAASFIQDVFGAEIERVSTDQ